MDTAIALRISPIYCWRVTKESPTKILHSCRKCSNRRFGKSGRFSLSMTSSAGEVSEVRLLALAVPGVDSASGRHQSGVVAVVLLYSVGIAVYGDMEAH